MEEVKENLISWSLDEINYLKTLVSLHGTHNWDTIASALNTAFPSTYKSTNDCREKWHSCLDSTESKEPWSEKEELEMLIAHQKHQNKWSDMAQALKGRSNNSIKNRFYSIFRKVKNRIIKSDYKHDSKFDLLETFYMIKLMEHYFTNPQPVQKQVGKRGKDFIYSLLKGIQLDNLRKYKGELESHGGNEITLEELWLEMANKSTLMKPEDPNPMTDKNNEDPFSQMINVPTSDKSHYTLPHPHTTNSSNCLSHEEKSFIQFQAFQNKEPCSAGIFQPVPMSASYFSSALFSAGIMKSAPTAARFEGFSDFTERNCLNNTNAAPMTGFNQFSQQPAVQIPISASGFGNVFL